MGTDPRTEVEALQAKVDHLTLQLRDTHMKWEEVSARAAAATLLLRQAQAERDDLAEMVPPAIRKMHDFVRALAPGAKHVD